MGTIYRIGTADRSRPEPAGAFRRVLATLALWRRRLVQRRELAQIAQDPHLLRDLGLSALDVGQEARKQFWRP